MSSECVPVILVGGLGTRIRHLLPDRPKPMAEVCSKPFLSWILELLANQRFSRVILSTGYKGDFINSFYKSNPIPGIDITCIQEPSPLGTAGGFLNAIENSNINARSWLVLNGDSLALTKLDHFVQQVESLHASSGILALHMNDASRYGTLAYTPDKNLTDFFEKKSGPGMINAGVYYFSSEITYNFPRTSPLSFETDVFPQLLRGNTLIKVIEIKEAPFIDIGTPETLQTSAKFIQSHFRHHNRDILACNSP